MLVVLLNIMARSSGAQRAKAVEVGAVCPNFLALFSKKFHKYVSRGKILKSRPLARRHRCWRRAYTSRRQRCRALDLEADMAVTWQAARRQ